MTPWSRHGQRPCQGSPGILLSELVLCITLPGVGPGKIHHCWIILWGNPGKFTRPVQHWLCCMKAGCMIRGSVFIHHPRLHRNVRNLDMLPMLPTVHVHLHSFPGKLNCGLQCSSKRCPMPSSFKSDQCARGYLHLFRDILTSRRSHGACLWADLEADRWA